MCCCGDNFVAWVTTGTVCACACGGVGHVVGWGMVMFYSWVHLVCKVGGGDANVSWWRDGGW